MMRKDTQKLAHNIRQTSCQNILNRTRQYGLVLSAAILLAITLLSLFPADKLPPFPGTDKTHHLLAYAIAIFPVSIKYPRYCIIIGMAMIAYSGIIELLQPYVNRYGEWLDLAANSCGVIIGGLLARLSSLTLTIKS